jgi:Mg-chelatase subunit ChlD
MFLFLTLGALAPPATAEGYGSADMGGYGVKVYRVNYAFYPYVQAYLRTFDQNKQPLVNLNEMNIGVMVKGRSYDPMKRQYFMQTLRQRQEATRTVFVLDASKSMAGAPFEMALRAAARYIDGKRPQDEVAVLAIRDAKEGYDLVSNFERDGAALGRRMLDIRVDGRKTRLYDSIGAAMQMCGMASQGSSVQPTTENYVASCSVIVFSDGLDEGSALSREELNGRITQMAIPIPVYSLAYSRTSKEYFKNLESISKNSFGVYYPIGEAVERMTQVIEQIQNILLSDYVVTFLSYVPVDGEQHMAKLGVEYPSGSGKFTYDNAAFEAIEPPPVQGIESAVQMLRQKIVPVANPYFERPPQAPAGGAMPALPPGAVPGALIPLGH